ncbi:hypothetical protein ACJRO7_032256 [Eucalyptus globulus]|uniref:Uncharacterized protein n=1 Tax=Eucalyptus globulus TaxID=34317 RepID=A0ABD3JML1_EUCGL
MIYVQFAFHNYSRTVTWSDLQEHFAAHGVQFQKVPVSKTSNFSSVSLPISGRSFPSLKARRFQVSGAAKKETVDKVCQIVRKQLALPNDATVTGESKFANMEADSLYIDFTRIKVHDFWEKDMATSLLVTLTLIDLQFRMLVFMDKHR